MLVRTARYGKVMLPLMVLVISRHASAAEPQGRWASADDQVAKALIDMERRWAEHACTNSKIQETILADDYQGTSPEDGKIYSKADLLRNDEKEQRFPARACQLQDAKVRFFGDAIAIVYGSETATHKGKSGREFNRSLVWTDTWLKRNGKWQIVASQDMQMERK